MYSKSADRASSRVAQRTSATPAFVFDRVTVVDVDQGQLVPDQQVVIVGTRIQAMGGEGTVKLPKGAQVVDARGKYLIPGLWDLHVHPGRSALPVYLLLAANGVTGMRDASSPVPLDTLRQWQREILAGTRLGPPRQLLSGQSILGPKPACERKAMDDWQTCVADAADARHYVDSLQAAGADMIKPRDVSREVYFAIAAEARRLGIPFDGHAQNLTAPEASDSGARIVDHFLDLGGDIDEWCLPELPEVAGGMEISGKRFKEMLRSSEVTPAPNQPRPDTDTDTTGTGGTLERCRALARQFVRNGTWWVPTWLEVMVSMAGVHWSTPRSDPIIERFREHVRKFLADTVFNPYSPTATGGAPVYTVDSSSGPGLLHLAQDAGVPMLAGTDANDVFSDDARPRLPGFALHTELALLVAEGLTPLNALRSATLNPATMLRATDSLGTVAPGKLADLVLLDADPLADITNTTQIRAVVANGRYLDRAALDRALREAQAKVKQEP